MTTQEKSPRRQQRRFFHRRKFCKFCNDSSLNIEYKQPGLLKDFLTERGKIMPRRITGTCAGHQRELTVAIKKARMIALLPYVASESR